MGRPLPPLQIGSINCSSIIPIGISLIFFKNLYILRYCKWAKETTALPLRILSPNWAQLLRNLENTQFYLSHFQTSSLRFSRLSPSLSPFFFLPHAIFFTLWNFSNFKDNISFALSLFLSFHICHLLFHLQFFKSRGKAPPSVPSSHPLSFSLFSLSPKFFQLPG